MSTAHVVCQICKRNGYDTLNCYFHFDNSYQSEQLLCGLATLHISDPKDVEWHTNTGATTHIMDDPSNQKDDLSNLKDLIPYNGYDSMIVGNGSYLPINHVGTGQFGNISLASP